jgi:hypothetical protein
MGVVSEAPRKKSRGIKEFYPLFDLNIYPLFRVRKPSIAIGYDAASYSDARLVAIQIRPIRYLAWDPCLVQNVSAAEGIKAVFYEASYAERYAVTRCSGLAVWSG